MSMFSALGLGTLGLLPGGKLNFPPSHFENRRRKKATISPPVDQAAIPSRRSARGPRTRVAAVTGA